MAEKWPSAFLLSEKQESQWKVAASFKETNHIPSVTFELVVGHAAKRHSARPQDLEHVEMLEQYTRHFGNEFTSICHRTWCLRPESHLYALANKGTDSSSVLYA